MFDPNRSSTSKLYKRILAFGIKILIAIYNIFIRKPPKMKEGNGLDENYISIYNYSVNKRSDINEHLPSIYSYASKVEPKTIVELGVRGGESTYVLEKVAKNNDAHLISCDMDEIKFNLDYNKWHKVVSDDISFATRFKEWCNDNGIDPAIDVLFIDTSHLYEHTKEEINHWFPLLSEKSMVIFHDTNMATVYKRRDSSLGFGWNNDRGVIRAIEEYFNTKFRENELFYVKVGDYYISHIPYCSGLTTIERL